MRAFGVLAFFVCSSIARQSAAIGYGTVDSTHTAVVAVLGDDGTGGFTACSGTIVQSKNGQAYVLTAAHCCNNSTPTLVVMSNDYATGLQWISADAGLPTPPSYRVAASSTWYDAKYNTTDHDFCMLRFAVANASVLALPAANDGLATSTPIETVGFGVTNTNANNSVRRHGSSTIDVSLTADLITASMGGSAQTPGACEGDNGGPILVAPGAAQASQFIVGVSSSQNGATCAQNTQSVASRVSSELGTGGFITSYLADTPIGIQLGVTPTDAGAPDAAIDATSDAAPVIDASFDAPTQDAPAETGSEPEPTSSGGCSVSSSNAAPFALALAALAFIRARRRKLHVTS